MRWGPECMRRGVYEVSVWGRECRGLYEVGVYEVTVSV